MLCRGGLAVRRERFWGEWWRGPARLRRVNAELLNSFNENLHELWVHTGPHIISLFEWWKDGVIPVFCSLTTRRRQSGCLSGTSKSALSQIQQICNNVAETCSQIFAADGRRGDRWICLLVETFFFRCEVHCFSLLRSSEMIFVRVNRCFKGTAWIHLTVVMSLNGENYKYLSILT